MLCCCPISHGGALTSPTELHCWLWSDANPNLHHWEFPDFPHFPWTLFVTLKYCVHGRDLQRTQVLGSKRAKVNALSSHRVPSTDYLSSSGKAPKRLDDSNPFSPHQSYCDPPMPVHPLDNLIAHEQPLYLCRVRLYLSQLLPRCGPNNQIK